MDSEQSKERAAPPTLANYFYEPDIILETDDCDRLNQPSDCEETYTNLPGRHNEPLLPQSLTKLLAVDSGSDNDEADEADYTEHEILEMLEGSTNEEDEEVPSNAEVISDLSWSDNFETFTGVEEVYSDQSGPTIDSVNPFELFASIWDRSIMERIVHQTNEYAWQIIVCLTESEIRIPSKSRLHEWIPVTVEEMYKYFAILIYMGLCYRGKLDEYWSIGVLGMPEFRQLMSRNRFLLISRFLHFVDNYSDIDINIHGHERKVAKIAPIVEHCSKRFQEMYIPQRYISLDESLLLWKGRLNWVQCIRSKEARFGIKTYELCEVETGYLLNFFIYTGQSTTSSEPVGDFTGVTSKIVLNLIEGYLGKGHCIVMDNFYNNVCLARFLKQNKTDLLGTLNRRRKDTPEDIKTLNERRMPRGSIVARHCGNVSVLAWKNLKLVTMISTYHNSDTEPAQRAGVPVLKPTSVVCYNKYMGGVDFKDQKLSMYLMERKRGMKWYIKVFRRLLNCSILNCYTIYRANTRDLNRNKWDHRQFSYALAEMLSKKHDFIQRIRPAAVNALQDARLDGIDHFPEHQLVTNLNNKQNIRNKRGRCARCRILKIRTECNVICTKCKVFLCIGECWRVYHTVEELSM